MEEPCLSVIECTWG